MGFQNNGVAGLLCLLCAGCGLETHEKDYGTAFMLRTFPDAADRVGLHSVFPTLKNAYDTPLFINYFPDEVAQQEVEARILRYCKTLVFVQDPQDITLKPSPEPTTLRMRDGTQREGRTIYAHCAPRKKKT